ncbi:hypothetical protein [Planctomicrobium sp. SH664]|uniref:hypothetical protein n=1 Tax=Planctomicrobium sp. SH664 TaxID=3448125 RepID=UPI003F5C1B6E
MKLARHSTVTMTMNYTHIGLEDQAAALANLPWGKTDSAMTVPDGQSVSSDVLDPGSVVRVKRDETPCWNCVSGNKNGRLSQGDKTANFMEAAGIE